MLYFNIPIQFFYNEGDNLMEDMNNIKVEIALGDLTTLKDYAGYYKSAAEERDRLQKEVLELRKRLDELKSKI